MLHRRKVGLSVDRNITPENFAILRNDGFNVIEVKMGGVDDIIDWKNLRSNAANAEIGLWSFHLPFYPFERADIASLDSNVRRQTVDDHRELIRKAAEAGIGNIVIHPSVEPILKENREEHLKRSEDSLALLAQTAQESGVVLCVEVMGRTCLGNCSAELSRLTALDGSLQVCFDLNHLMKETHADFAAVIGHKIRTIHVSDYDFIDEKHWLPGEGKIDWVQMMDLLDQIGYANPFIYEVPYHNRTSCRSRDLINNDFIKNYNELCDRLPLSVV